MNKLFSFIILMFIGGQISAQSNISQIVFGTGAGVAMAFDGATSPKPTLAFYGDAAFYPVAYLNLNVEGQAGTLSGAVLNSKDRKRFNNNFKAVMINGELQAGAFIEPGKNSFLDLVRNIYAGIGYGLINNHVTNVNILKPKVTDQVNNTLHMVPFKLGYEYNLIKNSSNEPVLKVDASLALNYIDSRGLDGYYDHYSKSINFYTYYSIGLRYAISLNHLGERSYNKFDWKSAKHGYPFAVLLPGKFEYYTFS